MRPWIASNDVKRMRVIEFVAMQYVPKVLVLASNFYSLCRRVCQTIKAILCVTRQASPHGESLPA
jgi:hypothetical protein